MRTNSAVITEIAEQMNAAGESDLNASSTENIMPVMGALNATAKPALAPAEIWRRRIIYERLSETATASPAQPPSWTDGPSEPAESPRNTHAREPANIEHMTAYHLMRKSPLAAPSVWGMPLPLTMGTNLVSVPMSIAPIASTTNSRGMNAGFSSRRAYASSATPSP